MSPARTLPLAIPGVIAALLAPTAALAHPGHGLEASAGLAGGFLHPLTGLDHLATFLLAGAWAALLGGRALLRLPLAMLVAMIAGFLLAPALDPTAAEALAAVATVSLVLAAVLRLQAPLPVAVGAGGAFGFAHGLVHGLECTGSPASFAAGMVASSLLLMLLGIAAVRRVLSSPRLARLAPRARR